MLKRWSLVDLHKGRNQLDLLHLQEVEREDEEQEVHLDQRVVEDLRLAEVLDLHLAEVLHLQEVEKEEGQKVFKSHRSVWARTRDNNPEIISRASK